MNQSFEEEVERTVSFLKAGKTILYPTDTIWGVGCDATNSKACDRVYAAKKRPKDKSLIVLVDSMERLNDYVANVPAIAYDLIKAAKKPLSIVYAEGKNLARNGLITDPFESSFMSYYATSGRVINTSGVLTGTINTGSSSVRCVYDLWYWGEEPVSGATTTYTVKPTI